MAADFGLRSWIDTGRWDLLALHLSPLVAIYTALGVAAERADRGWLGRPLYRGAALLLILLMELLALDGRMFHYLASRSRPGNRRPSAIRACWTPSPP